MKKFHQKPTIFTEEVSINVMNLEKSILFYENIIGLQVLKRTDQTAVLTANGNTPLLILEQPPNVIEKEKRTTGLYHFALLLPTRKDLARFLRHLFRKNIRFGASDHYVSEAIYINDPDENGIEVYRDRPSLKWKWSNDQVTMATEPLDTEGLLKESDSKWIHLPEQTILGHMHLHVADLELTERFYTKGLGFDVVTRYPGALFMSTGGYHHHLGANIWNGEGAPAPQINSVGLKWFTLVLPDEQARLKTIDQLQDIGAKVVEEKDFYITSDPSGNEIRLVI